jgi:hypothetical protein
MQIAASGLRALGLATGVVADLVLVVVADGRVRDVGRIRTAPNALALISPRRLDVEQVSDSLESLDAAGLAGLGPELSPDATHPDPQVLEVVAILRAPDLGQEFRVKNHLARVGGQVLEKQPFRSRQLHQLAATSDDAPLQVHLDVVEADRSDAGAETGGSPEYGSHPRRQLIEMERLGD